MTLMHEMRGAYDKPCLKGISKCLSEHIDICNSSMELSIQMTPFFHKKIHILTNFQMTTKQNKNQI